MHISAANHDASHVALFGDSLAWEARPYWDALIHKDNDVALVFAFGGTAPCDWIHEMQDGLIVGSHPRGRR